MSTRGWDEELLKAHKGSCIPSRRAIWVDFTMSRALGGVLKKVWENACSKRCPRKACPRWHLLPGLVMHKRLGTVIASDIMKISEKQTLPINVAFICVVPEPLIDWFSLGCLQQLVVRSKRQQQYELARQFQERLSGDGE